MEILDTHNNGLNREYKIVALQDDMYREMDVFLERDSSNFKVKGFRPGKAPVKMLRNQYGYRYINESINALVNRFVSNQLSKDKEDISLKANYQVDEYKEDGSAIITVKYCVFPAFELKEYNAEDCFKYVVEISDSDVDAEIEKIRKNATKWVEANDQALSDGLRATVSGTAKVVGKKTQSSFSDQKIVISEKSTTAMMTSLVGKKVGDTVTFTQKVSDNKTSEYTMEIVSVEKPSEYSASDELASAVGYESFAQLKDEVKKELQERANRISLDVSKRELLEYISDCYDFDVPQNILEVERKIVRDQIEKDAQSNDMRLIEGKEERFTEAVDALAAQRVRIGAIINKTAGIENVTVNVNEINMQLWGYAQTHGVMAAEAFKYYTNNEEAILSARGDVIKNKTLDILLEKMNLKEKKVSLDDIIAKDEESFSFIDECFFKGDGASDVAPSKEHGKKKDDDAAEQDKPKKAASKKKSDDASEGDSAKPKRTKKSDAASKE